MYARGEENFMQGRKVCDESLLSFDWEGIARTQSLLAKITHPKQSRFVNVASVNISLCNEKPLLGGASFWIKAVPNAR